MADEEKNTVSDTSSNSAPAASGTNFLLKERFEIIFASPQPEHDTNGAKAYKVLDRITPQRELFALICSNQTAPRLSLLPYYKSIEHSNVLKLVEYGTVITPPQNTRNLALIYQTPAGPRVSDLKNLPSFRKNAESFKHLFFSLLNALEVLKSYGIVHRAIRSDNIYFKDSSCSEIVLGDCLAAFPAFHQPNAYETIESLMADREGRGDGTDRDDAYAVGVTALSLLYRKELLPTATAPEVLRLKLKKTSYSVLSAEDKMPNPYVNLFKGLLHDNPELRWTYIQAYNFLDGKPNSFGLGGNTEAPKKSLIINGEKYYTPISLVVAMQNTVDEAVDLIRNGKLLDWVRSGLEDEKLYTQMEKLIKADGTSLPPQILVAKVCILLNPSAPIKVNNISAFPSGLSKSIFYTIKNQAPLTAYTDFFAYDLIKLWYNEQSSSRSPSNAAEFKTYISRRDYGYGIERIMYDFDNDLPCISPLLGDEFVISAPQILKALDNAYAAKKISAAPYDKTIIAYLRCKLGKKIDTILSELNSTKPTTQISALLHLYSNIQSKFGPAQLPHLAQWLINYSLPLIKSYHNIKFQKYLEREIIKYAKDGHLMDLYGLLESDEARNSDLRQYTQALKEANLLQSSKIRLSSGDGRLEEEARDSALHLASILAILVMSLSFILNLINWILSR